MKNMLMLVSALAGAFTVFADYTFTDITVAAGETKTIESVTACKSLSVSGTLILKNRLILDPAYNGSYVLAPNASDNAAIELRGIGAICTINKDDKVQFDSALYQV